MRIAPRSFWIAFAVAAAGSAVLALVPTLIDLDWNRDGALCDEVAQRSWHTVRSQSGECAIRVWALFERFLSWFCFSGGALLGPFALYLLFALMMRRH